jgi:hypothetical protein
MDILRARLAVPFHAFRMEQKQGTLCGDGTGISFRGNGWSRFKRSCASVGLIYGAALFQATRPRPRPKRTIWNVAAVLLALMVLPASAAEDPTAIAFQIRDELDETSRDLLRAMNIYLEIQSRVPNEELVNSVYDVAVLNQERFGSLMRSISLYCSLQDEEDKKRTADYLQKEIRRVSLLTDLELIKLGFHLPAIKNRSLKTVAEKFESLLHKARDSLEKWPR